LKLRTRLRAWIPLLAYCTEKRSRGVRLMKTLGAGKL